MGKVDQGVVVLWVARHIYKKKLSYIGYGGEGKQVRDILHIDDLYRLISMQIKDIGKFSDQTYNVGGGRKVSISLKELTYLCQKYTGETIPIDSLKEDRTGDIPIYITDHKKITEQTGWTPKITTDQIIVEITEWILENKELLLPILS
jgi:CDP-paratose 2-epimerase